MQSLTAVSCPPGVVAGCVATGAWGSAPHAPAPAAGSLSATLAPGNEHVAPLNPEADLSTLSCPTVRFCLAAGNESVETYHR